MIAHVVPATPLVNTSISAHKKIISHLTPVEGIHVPALGYSSPIRTGILNKKLNFEWNIWIIASLFEHTCVVHISGGVSEIITLETGSLNGFRFPLVGIPPQPFILTTTSFPSTWISGSFAGSKRSAVLETLRRFWRDGCKPYIIIISNI